MVVLMLMIKDFLRFCTEGLHNIISQLKKFILQHAAQYNEYIQLIVRGVSYWWVEGSVQFRDALTDSAVTSFTKTIHVTNLFSSCYWVLGYLLLSSTFLFFYPYLHFSSISLIKTKWKRTVTIQYNILTIAFHRNNMNSYISISGIIKQTDRETYISYASPRSPDVITDWSIGYQKVSKLLTRTCVIYITFRRDTQEIDHFTKHLGLCPQYSIQKIHFLPILPKVIWHTYT